MIQEIKTYFEEGNTLIGIEVCGTLNEKKFFFLETIRKNGELLVTKKKRFGELEELSEYSKNNCPAVIIINIKAVLSKIINNKLNSNPEALVEKAFPSFNFKEFYYELTSFNDFTLISIIKKEKLKQLLREFEVSKITIIDFSLGISALKNLKDYTQEETIIVSNAILSLSKNKITDMTDLEISENYLSKQYEINGLKIENNFLLSFSGIIGFVTQVDAHFVNYDQLRITYVKAFKNKRFFTIVSRFSLASFLVILLLNFLFFNYYFQKSAELQTNMEINEINKRKLNELKTRVLEKEKRVDAILSSGNSKSSYYLDLIGQSLPNSILLDQIQYQPLLKPIQVSKAIEVQKNVVTISGSSVHTSEFSNWIKNLEAKSFIINVETLDYDYQDIDIYLFSVKIFLDE